MKSEAYKGIFKTTALFGGVQVFKILINIIRSKFIAVLLGPAGMGINALLTGTLGMVGALTNFGLSTSAVKNVAAANATGVDEQVSLVVAVFRKWVWITGLLGFVTTLILSPWLSELTFGNKDYTLGFALLSITLLITQISAGQGVVLRGMRKVKYMAQSDMIGAVIGLIISIPLYYFFANRGIVPAIMITAVTGLLLTWYFAKKVKVKRIKVDLQSVWREGKGMLIMGFMLSLTGLITMGTAYVLRIFITRTGSIEDVGLYNAGFAIINSYVGLIFTALSADYYPRLSAVSHDRIEATKEINKQAETGILLIAPIICFFLVSVKWLVVLLYSHKFSPINDMMLWLALGMFFKASSWAVAFLVLAKGDSKVFFWNELVANLYILALNVAGYYFWGLTGLGVSFLAGYFLYLVHITVLTKKLYGFSFDRFFILIFMVQLTIGLMCFSSALLIKGLWVYPIGAVLFICSAAFSLYEIDKRLGLKQLIKQFKAKKEQKKNRKLTSTHSIEVLETKQEVKKGVNHDT
ncbi:oligosaccharide flippase family protein [Pedobacter sp. ASV28]|uniref:oligosaccharide flippase family protein n=1 Tax=Pedobacter sp. ASV28 TaxID=2795123 RepID=UPI0018EA77EA|nr:oligosaccharide flippase family protein [Pedobacter sp. ASV28]